jgi:Flp pilus assembly protein TadD
VNANWRGWHLAEARTALRLDSDFVPALINVADLDRARGLDDEGEKLLRQGDDARARQCRCPLFSWLLLVRRHDYAGAVNLLRRAHEPALDNARYAYVYAVALNSTRAPAEAIALLERAHQQHPTDPDTLMALVSIARDMGDFGTALRHAWELIILDPADTRLRSLVSDLEKRQAH